MSGSSQAPDDRSVIDIKRELYEEEKKKNEDFNKKYDKITEKMKEMRSAETTKEDKLLQDIEEEMKKFEAARNKVYEVK
jgi:hypothetical protein